MTEGRQQDVADAEPDEVSAGAPAAGDTAASRGAPVKVSGGAAGVDPGPAAGSQPPAEDEPVSDEAPAAEATPAEEPTADVTPNDDVEPTSASDSADPEPAAAQEPAAAPEPPADPGPVGAAPADPARTPAAAISDGWRPRPWEPADAFAPEGASGPVLPAPKTGSQPAVATTPVRVSALAAPAVASASASASAAASPPASPPVAGTGSPQPPLSGPHPVLLAPVTRTEGVALVEHPTGRLPRAADDRFDRPRSPGDARAEAGYTSSPMDVFPGETSRRRWPRTLGVVATVLIVLAGVYVGALWLWSDRVPPGATVAGVEIGGLPATRAVALLDESLAAATTEPIPVAAGETRTTLDPVAAGLTVDAEQTVDSVTGFSIEPLRLWHHLFGIGAIEPVTDVDEASLAVSLEDVAAALVVEPVNGSVVFVDAEAQGTDAVDGASVDMEAATDLVMDGWLTAARPLELPTEVTAPAITQDEVDAALRDVARPLVSAPIVVSVADQLAELPTDVVAGAASFVAEEEELALQLDGEALVEAVTERTTNLLTVPSDATFAFESGTPVVVPGTPGTTLDPDAVAEAVAAAGTSSDRTARVELVESEPTESTEELQALGVTSVVSEFSTPLTSEPRRTANIANGAAQINGTLVRPGETFSLTEALGPIDAAHGFVEAGAIVNGEHRDAWGGGLSQISTTTYNAGYFAGFEDVEHHPHSEWFARYPEGREATIFTGSLDMQWKNNTPYGALVQAFVDGGRVHVKIWSTPYWTVESATGGRSNVVAPTTVYSQTPTCEPQNAGNPGFTVTVTRRVLLEGVEQDKESWTVRYKPQNAVVCGPAPGDVPAPAPEPPPTP